MTVTTSKQDRSAERRAFVTAHLGARAELSFLAGDASPRTYYRVTRADGPPLILMDDPPPGEMAAFIRLDAVLAGLGVSVPALIAADQDNGLLLLEDFGDLSYGRALAADPTRQQTLYTLATDVLVHLHDVLDQGPLPAAPPYDPEFLTFEVSLFADWFLPAVGKPLGGAERAAFLALWQPLFHQTVTMPQTLALRDFHVDNLMVLDRPGLRACGLLDFQSARIGALPYDLMGLLEDARRDLPHDLVMAMQDRYLAARPQVDPALFRRGWSILAAKRHTKIIGGFVRTWLRDGKPAYLAHLPRVWGLLDRALGHPDLKEIRDWFDHHVPADLRIRKLQ